MLSRRRFLTAAIAAPHIVSAAAKPALQIGLAADAQYADIEVKGTRHYRASIGKLGAAVEHFNGRPLDFCVHLGDLIDREWKSFEEIGKPLAQSRHRFHHILGNHDFDVLKSLKPRVPGKMGMAHRYYACDQGGFRFVFLDTTEVSTYAHPEGSAEHEAGRVELERLQALKLPQAKEWNSGMSKTQLDWLEAQCAGAQGRKVIAFAHHPIAPAGGHDLWNAEQALELMGRHRHFVAWINGHNHAGGYAEVAGAHCLTMHGMVETAGANAFAAAEVHADRLILTGHGREPARELVFRA